MVPTAAELARRLQGLNIYLIGMMGSGKSSLAAPLAAALGYRCLDTDQLLEQSAGRTIAEIFASEGEQGFRDLETAVLDAISPWQRLVVATGGGVVSRPRNWGYLRHGVVVWLDAPQEVLLRRLQADPTPRPLLDCADPAERLGTLLEQRRPLYAEADLHLPLRDETPERLVESLLEALPQILRERPSPVATPVQLVDAEGRPCDAIH